MGGICGIIFNNSKRQVLPGAVEKMLSAMRFSDQQEQSIFYHRAGAMGAQSFPGRLSGIAECRLHEDHVGLAVHGSIYGLEQVALSQGWKGKDLFLKLLDGYINEGLLFLKEICGDFVIAIWDGRTRSLHLVTDRFRVHPLFYYHDKEKMIFGSRMRAIEACPSRSDLSINPEAIIDLVGTSIIPSPKTIYKEVKKIPAACVVTYREGNLKIEPYWQASFLSPSGKPETELAKRFRSLFSASLSTCLQFDHERFDRVGAFLSGGVDSSSVTGLMTRLLGESVKSFSIGFEEQKFNEIGFSRIAAKKFGSRSYEYFVKARDAKDIISLLPQAFDEPYGNASAVSVYFCAQMAKNQGVDILYAGDGGDELFAGNERYANQKLFDTYYTIPKPFREGVMRPLIKTLADLTGWEFLVKSKKYIERASIPYEKRITSYDFFNIVSLREFVEPEFLTSTGTDYDPYSTFSQYFYEARAANNLDRHLYLDWKLTLMDNDLIKFRMAEVLNTQIRFPFLNHHLVEFSTEVPARIKMRGRKLRSFQKAAFKDLLPKDIMRKKKHGFGLPIPVWLRSDKELREIMHDTLLGNRSLRRGFFRQAALEKLMNRHKEDKTSFYGTTLWHLIVLETWLRHHEHATKA